MKKIVVLFKSKSEQYERAFCDAGFRATFAEPLMFEFTAEEALHERLRREHYSGLVLTSPRAVDAVAARWGDDAHNLWSRRRVYAVGEASGKRVLDALRLEARGTEAGNAGALANIVLAESKSGDTFLFPGGDLRADTLPRTLEGAGLAVDVLTVYRTTEHAGLARALAELVGGEEPAALVFFSPWGCERALCRLGGAWSGVPAVSVGPATSARLRELGRPADAEAARPAADALVAAVSACLDKGEGERQRTPADTMLGSE